MSNRIIRDILFLVGGFGLIWALFTFLPIFPDKVDLNMSIENEVKIGDAIVESLLENDPSFKYVSNPKLDSAMYLIEKRLVDAIGFTEFNYKIHVIDNSTVNAFAMPGGYVFVYTGLIEITETPEELASVLAHEIGHIEQRHVIKKLIKDLGITILTSGDATVLSEVGRTATSTVFDRKFEREADAFALETLEKAKISPQNIAILFRRFKEEVGSYNENIEILMTHPHHNSRIKRSLEYQVSNDFKAEKIDVDWEEVKSSISIDY